MSNIQITHDLNLNNARSESVIVVNPNNPKQIVCSSKKFKDIHNYDFVLATSYSTDAGLTWHDSAALGTPGFTLLTDPALAWDDSGNVFLVGLSGNNPPTFNVIGIEIYKSTDGGQTWSAPKRIHTSTGDDKQWAAGDTNPASPFHGRVYAVWDDGSDLRFARTKDHGANWVGTGAGATPPGSLLVSGSFSPEINVAANGDIYIVSMNFNPGSQINLLVSNDGGDSFHAVTPPATTITTLGPLGPKFPGETFRVITVPTACVFGSTVLVAWADRRDGPSRIYFARSTNGGASWDTGSSGQPLLSGAISSDLHHFHPQLIVDPNGAAGCAFYEFGPKPTTPLIDVIMAQSFDGGSTFNHFTVTDQPWDPAVDAPWAHGVSTQTFIGDYFGLDAGPKGFYPNWTDTRTGIQELWTAIVPEKKCAFVINRSTLGQDEVDARRGLPGGAVIPDAFRVVVDGFAAGDIGVTGTSSTIPVASPSVGMSIVPRGNVSATLGYGPDVQRFTFIYDIDFGPNDSAFSFPGPTRFLTLNVTVGPVSAHAQIELIKQPNPFLLHGDISWLSIDLRVFVVRAGEPKFGVAGVANAADAPRFIKQVITTVTPTQFDTLSPDEDHSKLYIQPNDEHNAPVFNFALAKVHYIGLIGANNVRVFFRMFQAQTTSGAFDFPPGGEYRRATTNPHGQPIPLAGIQGNEYVTIPFFAEPRVDSTFLNMNQQTDDANLRNITAKSDGSEVDTFFGCWLDINQPFANRLPAHVPPINQDGPFNDPGNPALSIQQAILRNLHQCVIAEIAFDPVPIPIGKDPSNWDKLAQRNIAWSDVGSALAATTFETRPTAFGYSPGQTPDELMIDWGKLPAGSTASIYLPAVTADQVLSMASRMYTRHGLTRGDDNTLQCAARGITYIPIPPGPGINYAGLLSVELPDNIAIGHAFNVVVRQVTLAFVGRQPRDEHGQPSPSPATFATVAVVEPGYIEWRRVMGGFQLTIPVKSKSSILLHEERDLSVLRWIAQAIPHNARWYPVFQRYLKVIADRVKLFGGDPDGILPSPIGDGKCRPPHPKPEPHPERRLAFTGKIAGLIFDHFGDFEGFVLETAECDHTFFSREKHFKELAERAWSERLRITVWAEDCDPPYRPLTIVIHRPPATFHV